VLKNSLFSTALVDQHVHSSDDADDRSSGARKFILNHFRRMMLQKQQTPSGEQIPSIEAVYQPPQGRL
jgi:hypothetical protein